MADAYTGIDGLTMHLTGATIDGGWQDDAAACLGGFRASNEVRRLGTVVRRPLPGILIDWASAGNGAGVGTLQALGADSVRWTAPGDTVGSAVTIANGETKVLPSGTATKALRVRRVRSTSLKGASSITLSQVMNDVLAGPNITDAQRTAGYTDYSAVMLRAHGLGVTDIAIWIDAAPGVSLALETPVSGAIQTIANRTTAPTGVTWNSGTSAGTGLTLASLAADSNYGLWIRRVIAPGETASARVENAIMVRFTYDGATYTEPLSALYRIADESLARWLLFAKNGVDPDPTVDTPDATGATLPLSCALAAPGSGTRVYHYLLTKRNKYGIIGGNRFVRRVEIDDTGAEVTAGPSAPIDVTVSEQGAGLLTVRANYYQGTDETAADRFVVYTAPGGATPDPVTDRREVFTMSNPVVLLRPYRQLQEQTGAFAKGQQVGVLVRTLRTEDGEESANTTAQAVATIATMGAGAPQRRGVFYGDTHDQRMSGPTVSETVYIDQARNIRWLMTSCASELWADTLLVWRIRYDSLSSANNGLWTTFDIINETISGAASDTPVEVASWGSGSDVLYVAVNGTRRMKIDCTNANLHFYEFDQVNGVHECRSSEPVADMIFDTCFQVWDATTGDYTTAMSLGTDGRLRMRVDWRQRDDVSEFE